MSKYDIIVRTELEDGTVGHRWLDLIISEYEDDYGMEDPVIEEVLDYEGNCVDTNLKEMSDVVRFYYGDVIDYTQENYSLIRECFMEVCYDYLMESRKTMCD